MEGCRPFLKRRFALVQRRNDADLAVCIKIAPLLHCDPTWLYDESAPAPGASVPVTAIALDVPPPEISAVVALLKKMCPAQRGEVLGFARRVADEAAKDALKANTAR